jgi:hypothetical protein
VQLEKLQAQFPIEIDYEDEDLVDHCPQCHAPMNVIKILDPYEVVMTADELSDHDPPEKMKTLTVISAALY